MPAKKINVFQKLRKSDAYVFIKYHIRQQLQLTIPTKIWEVFKTRCAILSREQTCNVQTSYGKTDEE